MKKRIYLSPPHMGKLEQKYVYEAFESNWIAPLGPHVDEFEREISLYVGSKGAAALSSGTAALHLALRLLGVTQGDVVFTSTFTFVASVNPILYEFAVPVFIDSEPETWNMSPIALERALERAKQKNKLPKAVIVANIYGQSADMDKIIELCDSYHVPIIEDSAESLGATYKGKKSGTLGKLGIYSFNGNKIITTSGGGMLVSDDLELLNKARYWSTQARDDARHYEHSELGYNYRLSNVLAGIGRGQLRVLDDRVEIRRNIFTQYEQAFSDIDSISFMPESSMGKSTRWLTAFLLEPNSKGVGVLQILDMLSIHNIEARRTWKPMHQQPLYHGCSYYSHLENKSCSDELFTKGICLPSGSSLTYEDQLRVIDCILEMFKV